MPKNKINTKDGMVMLNELGYDQLPRHIVDKRVTDLMDLTGKKAIVTGAGSSGLGQAIAHRLAGLGADLVLIDLNYDGAQQNAKAVMEKWGTKAFAIQGNCMDWEDVERYTRESHELLGGIDILVNNPVTVISHLFEHQTKEEIEKTVAGTLLIPMFGARIALDYMIPQRSGHIINIASVGGRMANRKLTVYNASKSGVIGFTRNLAHEVSHYGIKVLGVAPGIMFNERQKAMFLNANDDNDQALAGREAILEGFKHVELGRMSIPEEVANMVAYLCTEAASYMVGQTIDVAGGQHMD